MSDRATGRPTTGSLAGLPLRDRTVRVLMALVDDLTLERDEATLLRLTLEHAVDTLALHGGATFVLDPGSTSLRLAAGGPDASLMRDAAALAARVVQRGRSLLHELPGGGWMAGTPLLARGQVLGVLVLFDLAPDSVAPDLELLEALGKQIGTGTDNARHYAALRASSERVEIVNRLTATLASSGEPRQVLPAFASELRRVLDFDRLACAFVSEAGDYLELACYPDGAGWGLGEVVPVVGSGPGRVALDGRAITCLDMLAERCPTFAFIEEPRLVEEGLRSYLLLPLPARGRVVGVLALGSATAGAYDDAALQRLQAFADALGLAFENVRLMQKTRELSLTDDVTPLYNYRFVHQILDRELPLAERYGQALSLIFLDLDNFKPINDQYGHLYGSRALREVGFVVRAGARVGDYAARYGGDEFVLVLPQTGHAEARELAEALRARILGHTFLREDGLDTRLGASVGVATFPTEARSKEALLRLADQRMYADKEDRKAQP